MNTHTPVSQLKNQNIYYQRNPQGASPSPIPPGESWWKLYISHTSLYVLLLPTMYVCLDDISFRYIIQPLNFISMKPFCIHYSVSCSLYSVLFLRNIQVDMYVFIFTAVWNSIVYVCDTASLLIPWMMDIWIVTYSAIVDNTVNGDCCTSLLFHVSHFWSDVIQYGGQQPDGTLEHL